VNARLRQIGENMLHVAVNGIDIAFEAVGEGSHLLILHGGLLAQTEWQPQVGYFAQCGYRVITCDLRGHGESGASSEPYSVALFASDVIGLLDALDVRAVDCCGHSLGGMVAQELAITYPERLRALVLAETSLSTASTRVEAAQTLLVKGLLRLMSVHQMARLSGREFGRRVAAVRPYVEQEMRRHAHDKRNYLNIWRAVFGFDSRSRLHEITSPTLILVGEHNRRTHAQARQMRNLIPRAELQVIPRAGHMLNWDNPEAFNETIAAFLRQARAHTPGENAASAD
jgi:pimeloyl-ACP methyl ester carboxylesterase